MAETNAPVTPFARGRELADYAFKAKLALDRSPQLRNALWLNGRRDRTAADAYMIYEYANAEFGSRATKALDVAVRALMRIEGSPNLNAPLGSLERSWQLLIAESHETRLVPLCRVAVDVDTGALSFYSVVEDRWLPHAEWLQSDQIFL